MQDIDPRTLVWALGSCCALHGKPFDAELLLKQHAPPYYEQLVVNEAKWEWQLLPKLEPWILNLPRNLMAHRSEMGEVSERYSSTDRHQRDSIMTIQSPYLAQIDPNYQPEICVLNGLPRALLGNTAPMPSTA